MLKSLDLTLLPENLFASAGLARKEKLRELGRVVVLAGPNGSGKTRLLRQVSSVVQSAQRGHGLLAGRSLQTVSEAVEEALLKQPNMQLWLNNRADLVGYQAISWSPEGGPPPKIIELGVGAAEVKNASRMTDDQRIAEIDTVRAPGLGNAYSNAHIYLCRVARYLDIAERDPAKAAPHASGIEEARSFQKMLQELLRGDLGVAYDRAGIAVPTLFGREFNVSELSEGQRLLLAWAIVLHEQRAHFKDAVILIDEPENHFHPDVCVGILETLRDRILGDHGQLWVATHSISVVAWSGVESLHTLKNGQPTYAGNGVSAVVDGLLGGVDGRQHLRSFLADAHEFGLLHFIAECLLEPGVVASKENDPQEQSFAALVNRAIQREGCIKILDYGAGKGRLGQAILRGFADHGAALKRFEYFAFDRSSDHWEERERTIGQLRKAGVTAGHCNSIRELMTESNRIDIVVMCNMLHEAPPSEWPDIFGDCKSMLRSKGSVIIIEDQEPSVGELPHEKGFILLDHSELRALFGGALVHDHSAVIPEGYRKRLSVLEVPLTSLLACHALQIVTALNLVKERALEEVSRLRASAGATRTQRSGRLHALYSMLHVNACLSLATLEQLKSATVIATRAP